MGNYTEAFDSLNKAIKINPKFAEAHYHLAVLLMDENARKDLKTKSIPTKQNAPSKAKRSPAKKAPPRKSAGTRRKTAVSKKKKAG